MKQMFGKIDISMRIRRKTQRTTRNQRKIEEKMALLRQLFESRALLDYGKSKAHATFWTTWQVWELFFTNFW